MYCPRVKQSTSASRNTGKREFHVSGRRITRACEQLENSLLPSVNKGQAAAACRGYILLCSEGNLQPWCSCKTGASQSKARENSVVLHSLQSCASLQRWHALIFILLIHIVSLGHSLHFTKKWMHARIVGTSTLFQETWCHKDMDSSKEL